MSVGVWELLQLCYGLNRYSWDSMHRTQISNWLLLVRLLRCLVAYSDDNVVFVGFSAWKSREDVFDAAKSRASEDWLEFLGDRGVVAITRKLYTIPNRRPRSA